MIPLSERFYLRPEYRLYFFKAGPDAQPTDRYPQRLALALSVKF
ncbi:MAG: hypothetical protein ABI051_13510 [Vicinamibacterales bacterium]